MAHLVGGEWLPSIWHFPMKILGCFHHPNRRSHIFQRGSNHQPVFFLILDIIGDAPYGPSGWWWMVAINLAFSHENIGWLSSSQSTKSYFSEGFKPPTSVFFDLGHHRWCTLWPIWLVVNGCHQFGIFPWKYWVAFIIPIDAVIFFRGVQTTNQCFFWSWTS